MLLENPMVDIILIIRYNKFMFFRRVCIHNIFFMLLENPMVDIILIIRYNKFMFFRRVCIRLSETKKTKNFLGS